MTHDSATDHAATATKYNHTLKQLYAYAKKHGKGWLYWDYAQGGPRARAKPSWTLEACLIGAFTEASQPMDVLAAIEEHQREFKIRTRNVCSRHQEQ